MVPASLYLGFTASIIWVGQVKDLLISELFSHDFFSISDIVTLFCRVRTLHQLCLVMLENIICLRVQH
jgi:hypothetical protein